MRVGGPRSFGPAETEDLRAPRALLHAQTNPRSLYRRGSNLVVRDGASAAWWCTSPARSDAAHEYCPRPAEHDIAGLQRPADFQGDLLAVGLEAGRVMALAHHLIDDGLSAHAGDGISLAAYTSAMIATSRGEMPAKFRLQLLGARVAVRLKHAKDALAPRIPGGRQRRFTSLG